MSVGASPTGGANSGRRALHDALHVAGERAANGLARLVGRPGWILARCSERLAPDSVCPCADAADPRLLLTGSTTWSPQPTSSATPWEKILDKRSPEILVAACKV
jgi:hypothetical protein